MYPETGEIWEPEYGPKGGDELNLIEAGKNYDWPVISYGINYNGTKFTDITEKEGMENPGFIVKLMPLNKYFFKRKIVLPNLICITAR